MSEFKRPIISSLCRFAGFAGILVGVISLLMVTQGFTDMDLVLYALPGAAGGLAVILFLFGIAELADLLARNAVSSERTAYHLEELVMMQRKAEKKHTGATTAKITGSRTPFER